MFKRILLPTDGSALANKAVRQGIKLAKSMHARITCVFVDLPYKLPAYTGYKITVAQKILQEHCEKEAGQYARKVLRAAAKLAAQAGVACRTSHATSFAPYLGILETARRGRCDLIAMASHGRSGLSGVLLGSETVKVLAHSGIPVLVYR